MRLEIDAKFLEHDWDEEKVEQLGVPLGACVSLGPLRAVVNKVAGGRRLQILTTPPIILNVPEGEEGKVLTAETSAPLQGMREVLHSAVEKAAGTHEGGDVGITVRLFPLGTHVKFDTAD